MGCAARYPSWVINRAGEVVELAHGYDREVIYALVKLQVAPEVVAQVREASAFAAASQAQIATIHAQLNALAASGKRVAIWSGTGKVGWQRLQSRFKLTRLTS
jgi:hypothetical protein